ncbi:MULTISPECIES: hypothetical protein [Pandoraea]|uniref:hypothetical protein n=1 Tax=Pandoraea TaxID=93217 RepID=UPI0003D232A3|nr:MULTISPECIES: hypothetical protein [Pandoraea]AHB78694.1 hypothetical protein X636_20555 [Pandoraea pnomenusa]
MPDNKTVTLADAIIKQLDDPMYKMWTIQDAVRDAVRRTAAPTPAAQSAGQEAVPVGRVQVGDGSITFIPDADAWRMGDEYEVFANAAPVNGGERELGQVIDERDQYHDAAEKLADAIAKHFGVEIGEHSNLNCPWQNALDHIAQATKRAADAQQVDADVMERRTGHEADALVFAIMEEVRKPITAANAYGLKAKANIRAILVDALNRAALTSPAKVGGDKRERFVQWYTRGTGKPISTNDRDAETAWDAWRAALSADGGKDKRDAERYRWAIAFEDNAETLHSIMLCHAGDAAKINERVDSYMAAAIAANQAKGDA